MGYDIPLYVVKAAHLWEGSILSIISEPPLTYILLWGVHALGLDLYIAIKIVASLFYGFLIASFYYFLRSYLGWDVNKSMFCALLCAFQPTALRISWDLLKNELGIAFLLLFIAIFSKQMKRKELILAALALLVSLTHELPTVLMFLFVVYEVLRSGRVGSYALKLVLIMVPAAVFFIGQVCFFLNLIKTPCAVGSREILWLRRSLSGSEPLFDTAFPRNYFIERPFRSASWGDVVIYVLLMFVFCFPTLLPLIPLGLKRHGSFDVLVAWMAFASFSVIACPQAYPFAHFFRWMLMMVFPLVIYVTEGTLRLIQRTGKRAVLALVLAINAALGVAYANGFSHIRFFPPMMAYMPDRMTYSTMELYQIDDCLACLDWLNQHAEPGSILVVEQRFLAWALGRLGEHVSIAGYRADVPLDEVELSPVLSAYEHVYTIWYSDQTPSWRGRPTIKIFESGCWAIYKFVRG